MIMLVLKECSALVFSSLTFLCFFLPVTVGLYFAMPGIRTKNAVLLVASLVFYAWGEPVWVLALIALAVLVWVCSGVIAQSEKTWLRRAALTLAVLGPMGVLMYVKYAGFLLEPVLKLAGLSIPTVRMPLGISFFTFQIVTYAVDVYRRRELYQPRLLPICIFLLFHILLLKCPPHYNTQGHYKQVYKADRHQIFPFEGDNLVDAQTRECPLYPH